MHTACIPKFMYVYHVHTHAFVGQKGDSDPWNWSHRWLYASKSAPEAESRAFTRTTSALNLCTISSAPFVKPPKRKKAQVSTEISNMYK